MVLKEIWSKEYRAMSEQGKFFWQGVQLELQSGQNIRYVQEIGSRSNAGKVSNFGVRIVGTPASQRKVSRGTANQAPYRTSHGKAGRDETETLGRQLLEMPSLGSQIKICYSQQPRFRKKKGGICLSLDLNSYCSSTLSWQSN